MDRLRFVVVLVAVVVLGSTAVAVGNDGNPLIIGEGNDAQSTTHLGMRDPESPSLGDLTLFVANQHGDALNAVCFAPGCAAIRALSSHGDGPAIRAAGAIESDRAGFVFIPRGAKRATVTLAPGLVLLRPSSLVLATAQNRTGSVQAVVPKLATNSFTIYLDAPASGNVKVAWFIIDRLR